MTQAANMSLPAVELPKLSGYEFYRSIGSPKWVVGPMVDQSELVRKTVETEHVANGFKAWRILSRSPVPLEATSINAEASSSKLPLGGATLCYTPMINAKIFANAVPGETQERDYFDLATGAYMAPVPDKN